MAYGRFRRIPRLPPKQKSSESSSATEDMSEDSSSGLDDEEETGLEFEMDSKDLCIEIKLAKDNNGGKMDKGEKKGGEKMTPSLAANGTNNNNNNHKGLTLCTNSLCSLCTYTVTPL